MLGRRLLNTDGLKSLRMKWDSYHFRYLPNYYNLVELNNHICL